MEIGVMLFPPLGKTAETAQRIEGLGFASLLYWFAIVGPPERALPRDVAAASLINLANEIVPALRG